MEIDLEFSGKHADRIKASKDPAKEAEFIRREATLPLPDWDMEHVMMRVLSTMPNITDIEAMAALDTYREYMREIKVNPHRKMQPPSKLIDTIWHTHIFLCTRTYMADCERYFGGYLHHAAICDGGAAVITHSRRPMSISSATAKHFSKQVRFVRLVRSRDWFSLSQSHFFFNRTL